jgi:hypothetical protein
MARAPKEVPSPEGINPNDIPTEFIEKAAYFNWERRGRPHGDSWYDWLEAEKEIKEWMRASGILPPKEKKNKK